MKRGALDEIRWLAIVLAIAAAAVLSVGSTAWAAKNVIIMVADGSGHNSWLATSMYRGLVGKEVYDQRGWRRFACSTYPLALSQKPTGRGPDESLVYDPQKAWDATPLDAGQWSFAGYDYLAATATDSAAAATALATGRKTYKGAINWSDDDRSMRGQSIAEIAKAHGKAAGVVTTVQWSDATPAALGGAHSVNRGNHAQIANEMLDSGCLTVIMGAGNPDYDDDGRPLKAKQNHNYEWVGGRRSWRSLKQGRRGWTLIESKAAFEALASGPTLPKVLGMAQVGKTLEEKQNHDQAMPIPNVPTLATMAKGAINCLNKNPKGFFLLVEGGAVDWANHANEPERMIEEQMDFLHAVEAVVAWVEKNSSWNDTLLILTADHESGMLWGPESDEVAFDPIQDNGPDRLPGMKHNSNSHTNSLVPLYARGPGSQRFAELVRGTDPIAGVLWRFSGKYVDNTDVFKVMEAEVKR
jgi:alkaline phosphatase